MQTFSIVTTCRNPGPLLIETVTSVLGQNALETGRAELQYVIVDGGSNDGTFEFLAGLDDPRVSWISEPDRGMYDGLAKGLRLLTGSIHAYVNAGDLYHPSAFDVVAELVPRRFEWLTGLHVTYNQRGETASVHVPFRYRREWIASGLYDGTRLPFIQQESTFWTAKLTAQLDLEELSELRLAGDAYVWATFARQHDLGTVIAHLGGFREHDGHLSEDLAAYREEMRRVCGPRRYPRIAVETERILWRAPLWVKKRIAGTQLQVWDSDRNAWH